MLSYYRALSAFMALGAVPLLQTAWEQCWWLEGAAVLAVLALLGTVVALTGRR